MVPLDEHVKIPELKGISPTGKVPCLVDGDVTIWESLAIAEYLAEKHPAKILWPLPENMRCHARAISAEMHAGFGALRTACPMNMRRPERILAVGDDVNADVARIMDIWTDCLARYGEAMESMPAWQEWHQAALAETAFMPVNEV